MKITIIGASAGVGLETVKRGLELGHSITTLSRSGIDLPENQNLTVLHGSALNEGDLKKSLENTDAVIVTLGTGTSTQKTTLYTDFASTLLTLHKEEKYKIPFVMLTGFGAGASAKFLPFPINLMFKLILKAVYINKTQMEEMLSQSDLRWEFVRPGVLTNKKLTEDYRVETHLKKGMKTGFISRKDVADFMVKEAANPKYLGQYPALFNR